MVGTRGERDCFVQQFELSGCRRGWRQREAEAGRRRPLWSTDQVRLSMRVYTATISELRNGTNEPTPSYELAKNAFASANVPAPAPTSGPRSSILRRASIPALLDGEMESRRTL